MTFGLAFLFLGQTALAKAAEPEKVTAISAKINKILQGPGLGSAQIGIEVYALQTGQVIYEKNALVPINPASNAKIITSRAALKNLGMDYRFQTLFYTDRFLSSDTINNLYVEGHGDPYLVIERLWRIAGDIRRKGVKKIKGNIMIDGSFFDQTLYPPGWPDRPGDDAYYAPTSAFAVNFNTVTIAVRPGQRPGLAPDVYIDPPVNYLRLENQAKTTGLRSRREIIVERLNTGGDDVIRIVGALPVDSKTLTSYRNVSNPHEYAGAILRSVLQNHGIDVIGAVKQGVRPANAELIFTEKSPPLSQLLQYVNKLSNNFMTEQVLKTMAAEMTGKPGSTEAGVKILTTYLQSLKIPENQFVLINGSGLSKQTRVAPHVLVEVLRDAWADPYNRPEFLSSLALGGMDGTLEDRPMAGPSKKVLLRAKTGSLNGVSCLSGFLTHESGNVLIFSILMNNLPDDSPLGHTTQEKIINALTDYLG